MTEIRAGLADGLRLKMWLGLATGVAALAALSATASAQYYPPPPGAYHGYYGNAPPLPPEDMDATDEPPVAAQPAYPPPYEERRYSPYPPVAATPEPQDYMRVPPALAGPAEAPPDARPPADVGGAGGVASLPAGQAPPGALPPEYQAEQGQTKQLPPILRRQAVFYPTKEPAGTIIIDTPNTYLYLVLGKDQAMRYGIGVGREGFTWSGRERITRVAEWPDWTPPKEMIERQPYLPRFMAGGPTNPLGARALYLGNTVYRIHGTNQPSTIGTFVSSGCIRLVNDDIMDLYKRVQVGTRVVVLPGPPARTSASSQTTVAR
ncbi:MAG: L,D-transpeptidase family protein [Xanthobacteraceae bacterium]